VAGGPVDNKSQENWYGGRRGAAGFDCGAADHAGGAYWVPLVVNNRLAVQLIVKGENLGNT
jgi:hypothetical protein